jgi:hypothetical protein
MKRDFAILLAHRSGMGTRELASWLGISPRRVLQIIKAENHTLRRCPVYRDGLGWNMLRCEKCDLEYDRRDCEIHGTTEDKNVDYYSPFYSFTCPLKHRGESKQIWRTRAERDDIDFCRALGIKGSYGTARMRKS